MNRATRWALASLLELVAATSAPPSAAADAPVSVRDAVSARFASDPQAQRVALELFDATGDEVDVLPAERMDGGYRGEISLVPALPVGSTRTHLVWVAGALRDFDAFFGAIGATPPGGPLHYRWRDLTLRFYRSVGNTTAERLRQRMDRGLQRQRFHRHQRRPRA